MPTNRQPKIKQLPSFSNTCCTLVFTDPNKPLKHKANETICLKQQAIQHQSGQVNITQQPFATIFTVKHNGLNTCKAATIKIVF